MHLIYAWIEKYRGIKNKGFSFDTNFEDNCLGELEGMIYINAHNFMGLFG